MRYTYYGLLAILLLTVSSCSDRKRNEDIFSDFEGEKGVYMVKLPPALFLKLLDIERNNTRDEDLGDINMVKLLIYSRENDTEDDRKKMYGRIRDKLTDYEYENIFGFNSSTSYISAYILENEDYVTDLMIVFKEDNSLACLGLSGRINGEEVLKFASEMEYNKLRDFID